MSSQYYPGSTPPPPQDYSELLHPRARRRPQLARRRPAVVAGVCRGLSVHLGGPVGAWRAFFVLTGLFFVGIILYVALAVQMPRYDDAMDVPGKSRRIFRKLENTSTDRTGLSGSTATQIVFASLFLLGASVIGLSGFNIFNDWYAFALCVLVMVGGGAIAWASPISDGTISFPTVIVGVTVSTVGAIFLVNLSGGFSAVISGLTTGIVVLLTISFVVTPVMAQLRTTLIHTNEEKIRESERADIAAHLHDSVLQTLSLIRSRANEPEVVSMLARSQEQDLRRYLYQDRPENGTSIASELRDLSQDLERRYQHEIDTVITGDASPTASLRALIAAAGEAMTNACKHGGAMPVSVYAEFSSEESAVWVRDRGTGFELFSIPDNRAGIRDSIMGRMEKIGGEAHIRTPLPNGGTEVMLKVQGEQGR
ncbi:ATP-binding protein [Arcanobacterium ihumii]|uniref:ATP-binding protein n=1 Tax=Arcanobacterium ihumii TaxID=2138162 RepID=UPI00135C7470|nr:ATP-binding protein [Arcanobacterium ihumii]